MSLNRNFTIFVQKYKNIIYPILLISISISVSTGFIMQAYKYTYPGNGNNNGTYVLINNSQMYGLLNPIIATNTNNLISVPNPINNSHISPAYSEIINLTNTEWVYHFYLLYFSDTRYTLESSGYSPTEGGVYNLTNNILILNNNYNSIWYAYKDKIINFNNDTYLPYVV